MNSSYAKERISRAFGSRGEEERKAWKVVCCWKIVLSEMGFAIHGIFRLDKSKAREMYSVNHKLFWSASLTLLNMLQGFRGTSLAKSGVIGRRSYKSESQRKGSSSRVEFNNDIM
jgi:hypothetical protein